MIKKSDPKSVCVFFFCFFHFILFTVFYLYNILSIIFLCVFSSVTANLNQVYFFRFFPSFFYWLVGFYINVCCCGFCIVLFFFIEMSEYNQIFSKSYIQLVLDFCCFFFGWKVSLIKSDDGQSNVVLFSFITSFFCKYFKFYVYSHYLFKFKFFYFFFPITLF